MPSFWLGFDQGSFLARFRDGQIPAAGMAAGLGEVLSRWTDGWCTVLWNILGLKVVCENSRSIYDTPRGLQKQRTELKLTLVPPVM